MWKKKLPGNSRMVSLLLTDVDENLITNSQYVSFLINFIKLKQLKCGMIYLPGNNRIVSILFTEVVEKLITNSLCFLFN